MHHASSRLLRQWFVAGLFAASLTSMGAMAGGAAPATGLGQSWPNATDVSTSPHWHVYVFERNGVRYVQVNDLGGKVRAAIAASNGHVMTLPVGLDASRVATPEEPLPVSGSTAGDIVYQDAAVKVLVAPQSNGTTATYVATGNCQDPIECSSRIN